MNQFYQTGQSPEQLTKQNPNTDLSKVPHPINIHVQTVQTIVQMAAAASSSARTFLNFLDKLCQFVALAALIAPKKVPGGDVS